MADQLEAGGSPLLVAYADGVRKPTFGFGLCGCGCGHPAPIAKKTLVKTGQVKGQPLQFIHGHHVKKSTPDFKCEDWGFLTPCWIWQKGLDEDGYARLTIDLKNCRASHVYFKHFTGKTVPDSMHLNHKCRIISCVNPDHLEICTPADNVRGGSSTQFDPDSIRAMIAMRKAGTPFKDIAAHFTTPIRSVKRICYGERWQGVVDPADLPKRGRHLSKEQALEAVKMRSDGMSVKAIAARLDVPFTRIYYVLANAAKGYQDRHQIEIWGRKTVSNAASNGSIEYATKPQLSQHTNATDEFVV